MRVVLETGGVERVSYGGICRRMRMSEGESRAPEVQMAAGTGRAGAMAWEESTKDASKSLMSSVCQAKLTAKQKGCRAGQVVTSERQTSFDGICRRQVGSKTLT